MGVATRLHSLYGSIALRCPDPGTPPAIFVPLAAHMPAYPTPGTRCICSSQRAPNIRISGRQHRIVNFHRPTYIPFALKPLAAPPLGPRKDFLVFAPYGAAFFFCPMCVTHLDIPAGYAPLCSALRGPDLGTTDLCSLRGPDLGTHRDRPALIVWPRRWDPGPMLTTFYLQHHASRKRSALTVCEFSFHLRASAHARYKTPHRRICIHRTNQDD